LLNVSDPYNRFVLFSYQHHRADETNPAQMAYSLDFHRKRDPILPAYPCEDISDIGHTETSDFPAHLLLL